MSEYIEHMRNLKFSDPFHKELSAAHVEALEAINKLIHLTCSKLEHPNLNQDILETVTSGALSLIDAELCRIIQNLPDALRTYMAIQEMFTAAQIMEHSHRPENPLEN